MKRADFDLVILGSGSTAFAAALRAQELGKTAVMTEERPIGGTCVNRGCLPSKNLIEAAKLIHDARRPRFPGLRPSELEFDFSELIKQKDVLVDSYRKKKYESLLGDGVQIEQGHARFLDPHTVEVGEKRLVGEKILIATGSRPRLPAIEGLADTPHITSDLLSTEADTELTQLPESIIILGGGYVALELGQMFRRFGSQVFLLQRSPQLLASGYEPQVGKTIQSVFENEGIQVVTKAAITAVSPHREGVAVNYEREGASQTLTAERLIVATGRQPNTDQISIQKAGVAVGDRGQILVDEKLRTNLPHVFAAGDVIGAETNSQMATPVGSQDGGIAARNAFAPDPTRSVDRSVIPRAIFTDPPIAVVGLTEQQAEDAGRSCWCNTIAMELVPRAAATRDTQGFIKMVADDETEEVLGVTMFGRDAAEVIHEAAMALRFHAKLQDFVNMLHVYPTMAEAPKIAAISRYKDPEKLSCCAE